MLGIASSSTNIRQQRSAAFKSFRFRFSQGFLFLFLVIWVGHFWHVLSSFWKRKWFYFMKDGYCLVISVVSDFKLCKIFSSIKKKKKKKKKVLWQDKKLRKFPVQINLNQPLFFNMILLLCYAMLCHVSHPASQPSPTTITYSKSDFGFRLRFKISPTEGSIIFAYKYIH